MTITASPHCITCDYCDNADYYFGNKKEVWIQAKGQGWLTYKGFHFDSKQCLDNYKRQITSKSEE